MPGAPSYPEDLLYHPGHGWARLEGELATLGVTWHAQHELGEIVFLDPPEVGSTLTQGEPYGELESAKAVSDLIAPLSGEIVEVNTALADDPAPINADPYGRGWIVRARVAGAAGREELLDAAAYAATLGW
jgi:glycine cleavage system H protein